MKIRLTFVGAGLWDGGDVFPYDDTPFPRPPSVGERVMLPDDKTLWRVRDVTYDFDRGLNFEPVVKVVCERES